MSRTTRSFFVLCVVGLAIVFWQGWLNPMIPDSETGHQGPKSTAGTSLLGENGDKVEAGQNLAKTSKEERKSTKDIAGGLPRVQQLLEVRVPHDKAIISTMDGVVKTQCAFKGAQLPCNRSLRDLAWKQLEHSPNHCASGLAHTHGRLLISDLEPLFTGHTWPKGQKHLWTLHPRLLASQKGVHVQCGSATRCIYIDLGARSFDSTVTWFLRHYPQGQKFLVHAFDMDHRFEKEYRNRSHLIRFHLAAVAEADGSLEMSSEVKDVSGKPLMMNMRSASESALADRLRKREILVIPVINFTDWLLKHTTEEDFVVLKFDIEGVEHQLLPTLISNGVIGRVDELMLECHYHRHDGDCGKHGSDFCVPRSECVRMLQKLRDICIYTHEWT